VEAWGLEAASWVLAGVVVVLARVVLGLCGVALRLMLAGFAFGRSVHEAADAVTHARADVAENRGTEDAWIRGHVEDRVVVIDDLDDTVEQSGGRAGGDWGGCLSIGMNVVGSETTWAMLAACRSLT
jgi:hypothetical protein